MASVVVVVVVVCLAVCAVEGQSADRDLLCVDGDHQSTMSLGCYPPDVILVQDVVVVCHPDTCCGCHGSTHQCRHSLCPRVTQDVSRRCDLHTQCDLHNVTANQHVVADCGADPHKTYLRVVFECRQYVPGQQSMTKHWGEFEGKWCPSGTVIQVVGTWFGDDMYQCEVSIQDHDPAYHRDIISQCQGHARCDSLRVNTGATIPCPTAGTSHTGSAAYVRIDYNCQQENNLDTMPKMLGSSMEEAGLTAGSTGLQVASSHGFGLMVTLAAMVIISGGQSH